MSTSIEWTDATWNPAVGCTHTSPGCDHCYASGVASRQMQPAHEGLTIGRQWNGTVRLLPERLAEPLRWRKPRKVFVGSMTDLFHTDVPDQFIADMFAVMAIAHWHTFQVLTKRPQRMAKLVADLTFKSRVHAAIATQLGVRVEERDTHSSADMIGLGRRIGDARVAAGIDRYHQPWPLPNVWLGTSIESDRYTFRANHLRATPAAVRFLSLEPLLGPLPSLDLAGIDWVIAGGESGPGARPMHPDWVRGIRDRCVDAGVPFLFKQWGAWAPDEDEGRYWADRPGSTTFVDRLGVREHTPGPTCGPDSFAMRRVGKHAAGRELDCRTWDEYPEATS